jgi:uncharacterized protein (DUF433 family)/DNA-binding transcriptional MerR regulator
VGGGLTVTTRERGRGRPRGRYLANEVGRLAGVSGSTVGQWARHGLIRASQEAAQPLVYSYEDVAEAIVVHELIDRGVPHRQIRRAIGLLRDDFGPWPLAGAELATAAGRRSAALVVRGPGGHYDVAGRPWQGVIDVDQLARVAHDLKRGGWAVRAVPGLEHIEVSPDRLSGRPTIRGRRVAAAEVGARAGVPGGVDELMEAYGLTDREIEDARRWWQAVRGFEAAA